MFETASNVNFSFLHKLEAAAMAEAKKKNRKREINQCKLKASCMQLQPQLSRIAT